MTSNFPQRNIERSKWRRTENPDVWKDQHGDIRNMTAKNPHDYRNGEGFQISNITQLTSFLPKTLQVCCITALTDTMVIIQTKGT